MVTAHPARICMNDEAPSSRRRRRVCFVTGTRAEFGLMASTLRAIQARDDLQLQLIATGMHLQPEHGETVQQIRAQGWKVDAEVPWPRTAYAAATGGAMAGLAGALGWLEPEIVLLVGDRVEAFAAASAAHLDGRVVAHVHGGDRAQGQADDALRHAITKLAHLHFAATPGSAERIRRLGERSEHVFTVGAPGIDGIARTAAPAAEVAEAFGVTAGQFALLVYHPTRDDETAEAETADRLLQATLEARVPKVVVIHPNNDPGWRGVVQSWEARQRDPRVVARTDVARRMFLGLMRDAAFLIGNSSSGIIEAASFGTPVIDVGPRQLGRERSDNVVHVEDDPPAIARAVKQAWDSGRPQRWQGQNVYGGDGAGAKIAHLLATHPLTPHLHRKLIAY